jgi:LuxR family maltose regulon positive regulatory protein
VRIFLDEGEALRSLMVDFRFWIEAHILDAARRTRLLSYTERLLSGFASTSRELPASVQIRPSPIRKLIEPLSRRELEVLRLIADGLTNQEIADRLVLSLPTVKWHTGNLYGKLGVNSRTQAAARARELGILTP